MTKRNWIRWWKWGTVALGTLLIGGVLVGWLMFQRIPGWYRPTELSTHQQGSAITSCINTFNGLGEGLNESPAPFEFRLTADQINAWLAVPIESWPEPYRYHLPPQLADPRVTISPDGLRVGVTFRQGSLQAVLVAHIEANARPDGVLLRLVGASAGALPVPKSRVRELLAAIDARHWPAGRTVRRQLEYRPMPRLAELYDGIVLPNAWIWVNGERPFRITNIAMKPGEMVFTLEPLARQAGVKSEPADGSSIPIWHISPGSAPVGSR